MDKNIILYRELVNFCNENLNLINDKFSRDVTFDDFNEKCFEELYLNNREVHLEPKILAEKIPGLAECYKEMYKYFLKPRNTMKKGLDIQLGNWYEKALQLFLASKGIMANKKGHPYPDFVINEDNPKAYYELKYINAPFLYAKNKVKNTYPYDSPRFDYECSLTLDTGRKLLEQREFYFENIKPSNIPFYYVWWFDAPHLKGIFFMDAEKVYKYWDEVGTLHIRKERDGDMKDKQIREKIYPPLLEMESLEEFIKKIS